MTMTADAALSEPRAAPVRMTSAPAAPATVLVVSRLAPTRLRLSRLFEDAGLLILEAVDPAAARQMMRTARLDLIVFECPSLIGDELAFCQAVAAGPRVPLLVLAGAADLVDEIVALELGADDLLAGEIADRLVLARARALLRRTRRNDDTPAPARRTEPAGWRLDPISRTATGPRGRSVVLAPGLASVLQLFLSRPGEVFSCEQGAMAIGAGPQGAASFRTMMCRLRQKLAPLGEGQPIQTVRGVGYTYTPRPDRQPAGR